jgi:hypothetical protein
VQFLGRDVTAFLLRFASSKAELVSACRMAVENVDVGSVITLSTLSSEQRTEAALIRLRRGLEQIQSAIDVILSHRAAAVREFAETIGTMGIAAPQIYIQHFEQHLAQELVLEAEELKSLCILFEKAEAIAALVQDSREELGFDEADIIFCDQDICDTYADMVAEYQDAQTKLQRAVEVREAFLMQRITRIPN